MSIKRAYAIFLRQAFLIKGNKSRLMSFFVWSLAALFIWGFLSKYVNNISDANFQFSTLLLAAVIIWHFFIRIQQGMTMAFLEDVWSRNFLNIFASPMTIAEYVLGLLLSSLVGALLTMAVVIPLAWLVFSYNIFQLGMAMAAFVTVLFIFGIATGLLGTTIVLRFGPSAEWFVWPIPAFFEILSGIFYPLSILPYPMQLIAKLIPPSYVFESMRILIIQHTFSLKPLLLGGFIALLYVIGMYWILVRVYRSILKNGLLSRFTAENFM